MVIYERLARGSRPLKPYCERREDWLGPGTTRQHDASGAPRGEVRESRKTYRGGPHKRATGEL